jgi:hypothetical protein
LSFHKTDPENLEAISELEKALQNLDEDKDIGLQQQGMKILSFFLGHPGISHSGKTYSEVQRLWDIYSPKFPGGWLEELGLWGKIPDDESESGIDLLSLDKRDPYAFMPGKLEEGEFDVFEMFGAQ